MAESSELSSRFVFLGLLVDLTVRMGDREPFRREYEKVKHIPFPAGITLAFNHNISGKVAKLLGQTGYFFDRVYQHKAETAVETVA